MKRYRFYKRIGIYILCLIIAVVIFSPWFDFYIKFSKNSEIIFQEIKRWAIVVKSRKILFKNHIDSQTVLNNEIEDFKKQHHVLPKWVMLTETFYGMTQTYIIIWSDPMPSELSAVDAARKTLDYTTMQQAAESDNLDYIKQSIARVNQIDERCRNLTKRIAKECEQLCGEVITNFEAYSMGRVGFEGSCGGICDSLSVPLIK